MNTSLDYLADQFVFWNLKKISYGYLELIEIAKFSSSFQITKYNNFSIHEKKIQLFNK